MPYCPICEKCLCSSGRKGTNINRKNTLASNLRKHKALTISGRDQKEKDAKFGGGIISTKCGHLFHQNCLNDYITTFRTKGDCYGTTYNVLCPLCGANLSNGKTLKIDIEAHFGILEEFFQDLCKLKYMNKELKRTLELEWADIADLEKKIEKSKTEYDNIKSLKRSNEQRCIAQEERISKAIEDASTCYRYREIEKQLLDENINLEAVARRMETIITAKLKSKLASPSSTTQTESAESGIEQEEEPAAICQYCDCDRGHYQDLIDAAMNTALMSSESAGEEDPLVSQRVKANGHVDISVQISVHSEWSMNSERSVASETVLTKRSSRGERLEICSSSSLSTDSVATLDKRLPMLPSIPSQIEVNKTNTKTDAAGRIQETQFPSMVQFQSSQDISARKVDEWARTTIGDQNVETNRIHRTIQYDQHQKKLISVQACLSPEVDKSKSYTVRAYPSNNLPTIDISGNSGREIVTTTQPQSIEASKANAKRLEKMSNYTNSQADKSRSYTIEIHDPNYNGISSSDDFLSLESDPLLQSLLNQVEDQGDGAAVVKHKPPKPLSCRSVRKECIKHLSATTSIVSEITSQVVPFSGRNCDEERDYKNQLEWNDSAEPQCNVFPDTSESSRESFEFLAKSNQEFRFEMTSQQQGDLPGRRSDKHRNKIHKKSVITPPNMFAEVRSHKHDLNYHDLPLPPICIPPPPMDMEVTCGKESPSSFPRLTNEKFYQTTSRAEKTPKSRVKAPSPRQELAREFDELVVPPPPASNSDLPSHLSLVIPPPPPMTARRPDIPYHNCCQTPESTRRLIESLLKPEMILSTPSPRKVTEKIMSNPSPRPTKQVQKIKVNKPQDHFDDNINVTSELLIPPPPPKMFEESDDDELLKSVINQAVTSMVPVPVVADRDLAETGAAGDFPAEPKEAPPTEIEMAEPSSPINTPAIPSVPTLSREYHCLAAERFAKDTCFQNSLQSSVQSVKVGAEPAEDNAHYDSSYHKRPGVVETMEYFYKPNQTRCVTPRSFNNNGLYRRSDYRLDNYSNYWAFENSVCTPIVIEHGPEQFTNRGDFITPEASYTILQGVNGGSHDRWLADGKVSLPALHDHPQSHHVQFYPRFTNGQNFP